MYPIQDLLSIIDCELILQNCLNRSNLKVASYTVKFVSDKIIGYLGEHFLVIIEYEDKEGTAKTQQCFMKALNVSDRTKATFGISQSLNAYNKEEYFCNFLLKEFCRYNIDTSFAPKSYFCKPYLVVLEDLSQRSFIGFPHRSAFLDLDHCKVSLKTLARFHAAGLLYECAKSAEQGTLYRVTEKNPDVFLDMIFVNDNNLAQQWLKRSIQGISDLIPIICENYNIDKKEFTENFAKVFQHTSNFLIYLSKFKGTVLHNDVWFNNFMFNYEGDTVKESMLIDYQLLSYGPPSVDVLHFIYINTRRALRDKYFDELIEFYYNELTLAYTRQDLPAYLPKDQYLELCRDLRITITLKVLSISERFIMSSLEESSDQDAYEINIFERRSEQIIAKYNNNALFKEVIDEDIIELYNMLITS